MKKESFSEENINKTKELLKEIERVRGEIKGYNHSEKIESFLFYIGTRIDDNNYLENFYNEDYIKSLTERYKQNIIEYLEVYKTKLEKELEKL